MRIINYRLICAVLIAMAGLGCNDSVVGPEESIIGSWQTTQGSDTVTWTFQSTGNLRVATQSEDGLSFFNTRYTVDDATVTIQAFNGNDDRGNPVNFAASTCTATITDRSLRLSCENGIATFTRLGPGSGENAV